MIKHILEGIQSYFQSLTLISKLKLYKHFVVPIIISLFVGLLIVSLAYFLSDDIGGLLSKLWIWDWGKETFSTIGNFLGGIMLFVLGLILYKHIVIALVSPFMSPVSEKIENYYHEQNNHLLHTAEHRKTNFQQQLSRGVRISVRNLFKELSFTVILLILSLVPVLNLVTTPLLFLTQAYYAGFGNMDYTLERHYGYKESVNFVKKNRGIAIGNGIVFILLLLIPFVGFIIVLPLSVTASSIKTIQKIHHER